MMICRHKVFFNALIVHDSLHFDLLHSAESQNAENSNFWKDIFLHKEIPLLFFFNKNIFHSQNILLPKAVNHCGYFNYCSVFWELTVMFTRATIASWIAFFFINISGFSTCECNHVALDKTQYMDCGLRFVLKVHREWVTSESSKKHRCKQKLPSRPRNLHTSRIIIVPRRILLKST